MPDVKKRPEFYYTRQGEYFVRWRALHAHLKGRDGSAYHDEFLSKILRCVEDSTALEINAAFDAAYEQAKMTSFEMSFDRLPYFGPSLVSMPGKNTTKKLTVAGSLSRDRMLARKFKWLGWLAYAKGIDRSPTHDLVVRSELRKYKKSFYLFLIRAWEQGWDDAYDYVQELHLERQSVLNAPKVLSNRSIPNSHADSTKKNMRPS